MSSIDPLTRIKALAQKATPGPWKVAGEFTCQVITDYQPQKGRAGGYGSGDDFVCFLNDGENGVYNDEEEQKNTAAYIAAAHPGVILAMCEEIGRLRAQVATQEVLSGEDDACMTQLEVERDALEEQVARLEKEADWLAMELAKRGRGCKWWCDQYHNGCIPSFVPCGYKGSDIWREAARKAVEASHD